MKMTPDPSSTPSTWHPTQEQITHRAREIWRARGRPAGQDVDIWLEAELQLRAVGPASVADTAAQVPPSAAPAPAEGVAVAPSRRGVRKTKVAEETLQEKMDRSLWQGGYGEGGPNKLGPGT